MEIDTNIDNIHCPFCQIHIISHKNYQDDIDLNELYEMDFFQCPNCDIFFKVDLYLCTTYDYIISKPSEEEIRDNNLLPNKNIIIDHPGQTFMWEL